MDDPVLSTLPPVPTTPSGDDKVWMIGCHLSLLLGVGYLVPFIVWLAKREESPLVSAHAKEALNFHLGLLLYGLLCIPLVFFLIGIPLILLLGLVSVIFAILAAIEASNGRFFYYPLCIRFLG